jgi:uncharacterized protein
MESIYLLSPSGLIILLFSGFIIGLSKTAVPGLGTLAIPLSAMVLPARASTGVVLVMLICGDIFAVAYYRRNAVWSHLLRLFPYVIAGIIIGYFLLGRIDDSQLRPVIGLIILFMLGLNHWWKKRNKKEDVNIPSRWWFAAFMGLLAGTTTMLANAAGPIMVIYLLAMGLPKKEFIGTGAWYFFLGNLIKVPFSANLGLINSVSLELNLTLFPGIALGAVLGILVLKKIPEKAFNIIVQVLTVAAAIKLLF